METRQEVELREYLRHRGIQPAVAEYVAGGTKSPVGIVGRCAPSSLARIYREEFLKATDEVKRAEVLASKFPTSDNIKALGAANARVDFAAHRLSELGDGGFAL